MATSDVPHISDAFMTRLYRERRQDTNRPPVKTPMVIAAILLAAMSFGLVYVITDFLAFMFQTEYWHAPGIAPHLPLILMTFFGLMLIVPWFFVPFVIVAAAIILPLYALHHILLKLMDHYHHRHMSRSRHETQTAVRVTPTAAAKT